MVVTSPVGADIRFMPKSRDITDAEVELARNLGKRLKELRAERGLTQEQVAEKAGIATYTYQKYEKGMSKPGKPMNPEFFTLRSLSVALEVDLKVLLDF